MKKFNKLLKMRKIFKKIATVLSDEYFGHYLTLNASLLIGFLGKNLFTKDFDLFTFIIVIVCVLIVFWRIIYMVRQYQNDKKYRAYFRENIKK